MDFQDDEIEWLLGFSLDDGDYYKNLNKLNAPHLEAIVRLLAQKTIDANDSDEMRAAKGRRCHKQIQAHRQLMQHTYGRSLYLIPPPGDGHVANPTPATGFLRERKPSPRWRRPKITMPARPANLPEEVKKAKYHPVSGRILKVLPENLEKSDGKTPNNSRTRVLVRGLSPDVYAAIAAFAKTIGDRSLDQAAVVLLDEALASRATGDSYNHPKKRKGAMTRDLNIRNVPVSTVQAIDRLSETEGRSRAEMTRRLLSEALYCRKLVDFVRANCPE